MTQAILEQPLTEPRQNESTWKLHLRPAVELTDDQYFALCGINRDLRLERNAEGDLIIMPPTGAETGNRNFEISRQFSNWAKQDGTGAGFDSST